MDSEAARREALRLPATPPPPEPLDDSGDPLGGGDEGDRFIAEAQFRVRRRAERGDYSDAASRSLPLVALLAQVGFGGALCLVLGYCYVVRAEAESGTAWAVAALANSDAWFLWPLGGPLGLFTEPPGGPLTLIYAGANGLNALRCLPLLFDRLLVARLPGAGEASQDEPRDEPE